MARASGVANVVMGVAWRTMMCCWCVTVRAVDKHITCMSCSSLELKRLAFWQCDMCVIAERVARRRRRAASDMAVINGWQRKATVAMGEGLMRKRARTHGDVAITGSEGQLGAVAVNGQ